MSVEGNVFSLTARILRMSTPEVWWAQAGEPTWKGALSRDELLKFEAGDVLPTFGACLWKLLTKCNVG